MRLNPNIRELVDDETLAERIRSYWRERGQEVLVAVKEIPVSYVHNGILVTTVTKIIRSDMKNGLPARRN